MEILIGELRESDLSRGFLEALATLTEVGLSVADVWKLHLARLSVGEHTYVARIGDQVVGTASLLVERKFIHGGGLVGHIEDVAVSREHQRKGIGTSLVRHATEQAKILGCYKVILNCFEKLVPFYLRLGYRHHDCCLRIDL